MTTRVEMLLAYLDRLIAVEEKAGLHVAREITEAIQEIRKELGTDVSIDIDEFTQVIVKKLEQPKK